MARNPKVVKVEPDSEVDRLLDEVEETGGPILLDRNGRLYELTPKEMAGPEDLWASYDPNAALEGMKAAIGTWSDIDAEAFKAFIYRSREEGSRPADRP